MAPPHVFEPARIEIGNPSGLTPLDIAFGAMLGYAPCEPLPRRRSAVSLDDVLFDLLEPALASGRCLVSFSGGRESAFLLAAATAAARTRGHPDPIPATLRYPESLAPRVAPHQERIVSHLRLQEWERVEISDELELLGPLAQRALLEAGLLFPVTSYILLPLFDAARGGWLLIGGGWTDFFAFWRWARVADVLAGRRRPSRQFARQCSLLLLPPPLRRAALRSRGPRPGLPWLREPIARAAEGLVREREADVPFRFDRTLDRQRRHRCYRGINASFEALAAVASARVLLPFRTDEYMSALAAAGGGLGLGNRSQTVSAVAGHWLPLELLQRSDRTAAQTIVFGEATHRFLQEWSGDGLDAEVVDVEALAEIWGRGEIPWSTTTLLQLAFAHEHLRAAVGVGKRDEVS